MAILYILGLVVMLIGYIWLIVVAFKVSIIWGIVNIFFQPITGLIFCVMNKTGWKQFLIMIVGLVIWLGFGGLALMSNYPGVR